MKTIFICEYVTGGGYINKKISKKLFVQANIILKSLLNDFNKIPNLKIIYTWDYRYKEITKRKRIQCVFIKKNPWKIWSHLIKKSNFFFPIAPESNGDLLKIVKFGNSQKKNLIGSNIVAIKIASSKYKTYKLFKKYSIPTIPTFKNIKKINYKNNNKWVVKPDDGAGCEKNHIFSDKNKMLNFVNSNTNYIIQPLIKGKSYSVNVISSKSNFRILNFNKQKILFDKEKITFNGTKFLKKIAYEKKIKKYINIIIKKLSGLNSFFGIDFIIFKQKILFVDINPRITTSYKELSKNMKINVAQQILNTTR